MACVHAVPRDGAVHSSDYVEHEEPKKAHSKRLGSQALAGGASGLLTRVAVGPLDVLKIRFQLQFQSGTQAKYTGMLQASRKILREEGIRGLYRGTLPSLALWFVYSSVQFPVYTTVKQFLQENQYSEFLPGLNGLVAGAVAATAASVVAHPLDTIRTQWVYQGLPPGVRLPMHVWGVLRNEGPRGFYRGLSAALVQTVPGMALTFCSYEMIKAKYLQVSDQTRLDPLGNVGVGGLAGLVSKLAVYPLDTIKKRLQINSMLETASSREKYAGIACCVRTMFREEGVRGFFKGTTPAIAKASLASALTFSTYEGTLRFLAPKTDK